MQNEIQNHELFPVDVVALCQLFARILCRHLKEQENQTQSLLFKAAPSSIEERVTPCKQSS